MNFLPKEDVEYLVSKGILYEEVVEGPHHALILQNICLPEGKYNSDKVDILILLPNGYNDIGPDMFYTYPWIKLIPQNVYAKATNVAYDFHGVIWQRWSRHAKASDWRPGIDGIRTIIKRVEEALKVACP